MAFSAPLPPFLYQTAVVVTVVSAVLLGYQLCLHIDTRLSDRPATQRLAGSFRPASVRLNIRVLCGEQIG